MSIEFIFKYIIAPTILSMYYAKDKQSREKSFQYAKSIWYFYYAIATTINLINGKISTDELAGFSISLALLEGLPNFILLIKWKVKILLTK